MKGIAGQRSLIYHIMMTCWVRVARMSKFEKILDKERCTHNCLLPCSHTGWGRSPPAEKSKTMWLYIFRFFTSSPCNFLETQYMSFIAKMSWIIHNLRKLIPFESHAIQLRYTVHNSSTSSQYSSIAMENCIAMTTRM